MEMGGNGERTVVYHDRDGTGSSNVLPVIEQSLSVGGQDASIVAAADDDGEIGASVSSVASELNGLSGARSTGTDDGWDGSETGIVEGVACGVDELDAFGVGEMDGLAHGTGDDGIDAGCSELDDMGLEGGDVWNGDQRGFGAEDGSVTDQDPRTLAGKRTG
jgi:hypothetical protein